MGPNLTRLFELSKSNMAGPEEWEAPFKLEELFKAHGEALIEALERLLEENEDYIRINNLSAMGNVNLVNARQLLAQLELEAKP